MSKWLTGQGFGHTLYGGIEREFKILFLHKRVLRFEGGGTERENKGGGADVMKQDGEARRPRNRSQKQTTKSQQVSQLKGTI